LPGCWLPLYQRHAFAAAAFIAAYYAAARPPILPPRRRRRRRCLFRRRHAIIFRFAAAGFHDAAASPFRHYLLFADGFFDFFTALAARALFSDYADAMFSLRFHYAFAAATPLAAMIRHDAAVCASFHAAAVTLSFSLSLMPPTMPPIMPIFCAALPMFAIAIHYAATPMFARRQI